MFRRTLVTFASILALLLAQAPGAAAADINLKWTELGGAVAHREVKLSLRDGARLQGTVLGVSGESLDLNIVKTSDKKAHPAGQSPVTRTELREIRVLPRRWHGRLIGGVGGGIIGAYGLAGAVTGNRDDASVFPVAIAVTAASTIAGILIGDILTGRLVKREIRIVIADE